MYASIIIINIHTGSLRLLFEDERSEESVKTEKGKKEVESPSLSRESHLSVKVLTSDTSA